MAERAGNEYLEFPEGADGTFPEDEIAVCEIVLGEDTTNTCNIAIADVDGDGLEEIATPLTLGEDDCVRLYRGNGELAWENEEVRLYHAYYNDREPPPRGLAHMWHRTKHRHVLTEIVDLDGDGRLEVIVGDGPLYVLDARTGDTKRTLDLNGRVALWNVVYDPTRKAYLLAATADDRDRGPHLVALDPEGREVWALPTPGRVFVDCMHHGDLDGDGRPEIGFSIEEAREFWLVDCDGNLRWKKHVSKELGDDPHVDDFLIDQVLPEERIAGRQLLLVTGPNLLDTDGHVLWTRRDDLDHAQKVLAADLQPDRPGKEVYTVESFRRRAFLFTCDGEPIWCYDNFTRVREGYEHENPERGRAIGRLTTAGDLINWSGRGKVEIVQPEMGGAHGFGRGPRRRDVPPEAVRRFAHVLDRDGNPVAIFPIDCSPMCARACNVTPSPTDDLVMVGHHTSRMYVYSRK